MAKIAGLGSRRPLADSNSYAGLADKPLAFRQTRVVCRLLFRLLLRMLLMATAALVLTFVLFLLSARAQPNATQSLRNIVYLTGYVFSGPHCSIFCLFLLFYFCYFISHLFGLSSFLWLSFPADVLSG